MFLFIRCMYTVSLYIVSQVWLCLCVYLSEERQRQRQWQRQTDVKRHSERERERECVCAWYVSWASTKLRGDAHTHVCMHERAALSTYIYAYECTWVHTHKRTHTHSHKHKHTHTQITHTHSHTKRVLKDFRWFIRHHSSVVESVALKKVSSP